MFLVVDVFSCGYLCKIVGYKNAQGIRTFVFYSRNNIVCTAHNFFIDISGKRIERIKLPGDAAMLYGKERFDGSVFARKSEVTGALTLYIPVDMLDIHQVSTRVDRKTYTIYKAYIGRVGERVLWFEADDGLATGHLTSTIEEYSKLLQSGSLSVSSSASGSDLSRIEAKLSRMQSLVRSLKTEREWLDRLPDSDIIRQAASQ